MAVLEFQFSTSTAWQSGVIRRLTHSRFSHVDLILPGEGLLGVSGKARSIKDVGGVLIRPFGCWEYRDKPLIAKVQCTDAVAQRTIEWGRGQVGKPFDNGALWHFLRDRAGVASQPRQWRDPGQWFCSEYWARGTEYGGVYNYPLIMPKEVVSPNDLLLFFNPYMSAVNIQEFSL